jgi:predicted DNA-binding protein
MANKRLKKVVISVYVEPEQKAALDKLSKQTRVPTAIYLREGVDLVLKKHARKK